MNKESLFWGSVGAVLVPAFEFLYGAGEAMKYVMLALFLALAMDWITGIRAAEKDKSYASRYGIDGIFRSVFLISIPALVHLIGKGFDLPPVIPGFAAAVIMYHIIKSMVANAIRAGWADWLPVKLFDLLFQWVESEIMNKVKRALERGGKSDQS